MNNIPLHADAFLDTSGLECPHPLLLTKKKLATLHGGQILQIKVTDPGSVVDFKVFTRMTGNELVHFCVQATYYEFWIRKKMDS